MSEFEVVTTFVNQFHLLQAEDLNTGLEYRVFFFILPLGGGGSDLQAIVDPISENRPLWKCWLREIETPRVDSLRSTWNRSVDEGRITGHLNIKDNLHVVILDVLEAYLKTRIVPICDPSSRKTRYQRNPVI